MSSVILTPATTNTTTSPGSWSFTDNPASGGSMTLAVNVGPSGSVIGFLTNLSAGIPLDATIDGIQLAFKTTTSGGFSGSDVLTVGLGYFTDINTPLALGTKTLNLSGKHNVTSTLGSSSDQWDKPFWTRYQFTTGSPGILGISFARTSGTCDVTISEVVLTITYTLSTTLVGSRAPVPADSLGAQARSVFTLKTDGADDSCVVRSADINLLGDGIYNLENYSILATDQSNDVKLFGSAVGENIIATTFTVTGKITDPSGDLQLDECLSSDGNHLDVVGMTNVYRSLYPLLPNNTSVEYEFVGGHAWVTSSSGTVIPANLNVSALALRNLNNVQSSRLALRVTSASAANLANYTNLNGYAGIYIPNDGVASEFNDFAEFRVVPPAIDGSPNIPGFGVTYTNGASYSANDPQPFISAIYQQLNGAGQPVFIPLLEHADNKFNSVNIFAKGYKEVNNASKFDYVETEIWSGVTPDVVPSGWGTASWAFHRSGIFLFGSGTGASLSGYALLFTKGGRSTRDSLTLTTTPGTDGYGVMWLVKLTNLNTATLVDYTGFSTSSTTAYQTFPWPGANTQIQALSSYNPIATPSNQLSDISLSKRYRFSVTIVASTAVLKLESYSYGTNSYTTVATVTDSSSPYLVAGKSGFFQIKPNLPVNSSSLIYGTVDFKDMEFGYQSIPATTNITMEARIFALGRLKNVSV